MAFERFAWGTGTKYIGRGNPPEPLTQKQEDHVLMCLHEGDMCENGGWSYDFRVDLQRDAYRIIWHLVQQNERLRDRLVDNSPPEPTT